MKPITITPEALTDLVYVYEAVSTLEQCLSVYCRIKIPKVADKNGESCISKMEKVAGQGDVHDPVEKAAP